jgi:hypothetical protein
MIIRILPSRDGRSTLLIVQTGGHFIGGKANRRASCFAVASRRILANHLKTSQHILTVKLSTSRPT